MTCRDVSTLVATGQLQAQPWPRRFHIRMHLAMCRHCGRFWRQVGTIDRGLRHALGRLEPGDDEAGHLEERILERLRRKE